MERERKEQGRGVFRELSLKCRRVYGSYYPQRGVDHKSDLPLSLNTCQVTASQ